jgi:cellulose 1,4-beta-cellobiosidase
MCPNTVYTAVSVSKNAPRAATMLLHWRFQLSVLLLSAAAATAQQGGNPFASGLFYVNPAFQSEIASSIATCTNPTACANLRLMSNISSAFWIDTKSKINGDPTDTVSVSGILADAASRNPPPTVVFIVYDVPNRDCHAKASNGEICCTYNADKTCNYDASGDCAAGIAEYETTYIDPLVALFAQYNGKVPIVAIIEPDSLPNLSTNQGDPHCGNSATNSAYTVGIPYTINAIATKAPAVSMYLDAAHGGWLGWENNAQAFASLVQGLGITQHLRGFATNVANYQPLGVACATFDWCLPNNHPNDACCSDPCHLESQYDPGVSEHQYVQVLEHYFQGQMASPKFIVDTGRNGVDGMRAECANWCNIRGAGVGRLPTSATDLPAIDAYFCKLLC